MEQFFFQQQRYHLYFLLFEVSVRYVSTRDSELLRKWKSARAKKGKAKLLTGGTERFSPRSRKLHPDPERSSHLRTSILRSVSF